MGEHGLPVKHLADGDAIKATDELFIYPRFDRVRVAEFMEFAIGGLYLGGDPRSWLIPARRPGTGLDDSLESGVQANPVVAVA